MGLVTKTIEWWGYRLGSQLAHLVTLPINRMMRTEVPVLDEEGIMQFAIQCFGGPKDGHREVLERDSRPEMVYVWENHDDHMMSNLEGPQREAARARVGTLAYRFDHMHVVEGLPRDKEYAYLYTPQRNKRHAEKAVKAPKK